MSTVKSLSHMLLASIFISGGANTFMHPDTRAVKVADAGISRARQATILNGMVMMLAGMALALGIMPKLASAVLMGSLLPTTFVGHPFWKEETPAGRANQQVHFLKNVAALGGLLLVLTEKNE